MNHLKYQFLFLIGLFLCTLMACSDIEVIQEKDEAGKLTAEFERRKSDFAKHGSYKSYHENGKLFEEATYQNNLLEGVRKLYTMEGRLETTETYVANKFEGPFKNFHPNDQIQQEGNYVDNVMAGEWKFYYKNGQLKEVVLFKDNDENGPFKEFHENGQLKTTGIYKDGPYETGELIIYNEAGKMIKKMDCAVVDLAGETASRCTTTWKAEDEN